MHVERTAGIVGLRTRPLCPPAAFTRWRGEHVSIDKSGRKRLRVFIGCERLSIKTGMGEGIAAIERARCALAKAGCGA